MSTAKRALKNLSWGFVVIATAGFSCDRERVANSSTSNNLSGTRGLWNDFAHFAISSRNAIAKGKRKKNS